MEIKQISIKDLKHCPANMRKPQSKKHLGDILPSIRQLGVVQSLVVRPNCEGFEVVAGGRRLAAASIVAEETGADMMLPCGIMADGDDAAALEISMIENLGRKTPDPIQQYLAFSKLHKEGRSVEDIAALFGITTQLVNKRMALGNLNPKIHKLFQNEDLDAGDLQTLTLASKERQKEWLCLYHSEEERAPSSWRLKDWICGGDQISVDVALFDLNAFEGETVTDLFEDNVCFANAEQFWTAQNEALAAMKDAYLADGWPEVVVQDVGDHFASWDYEETPRETGGRIYIEVSRDGTVTAHEGLLTRREAANLKAAENGEVVKPVSSERTELIAAAETYVSLHRHAAVRTKLATTPDVAYRLMVAEFIKNRRSRAEYTGNAEIADSVENAAYSKRFATQSRKAIDVLGLGKNLEFLLGDSHRLSVEDIFAKLTHLTDKQVMQIAAVAAAENLESGSMIVDVLGEYLDVDMTPDWRSDDTFLGLIRAKDLISALLKQVAGKKVADQNLTATGKVMKGIIRDFLTGENGRTKVEGWTPNWFKFPFTSYVRDDGLKEITDKKTRKGFLKSLKAR